MLRTLALILAFAVLIDDAKAQTAAAPQSEETSTMSDLEQRAGDVISVLNEEADTQAVFAPVFLDAIPEDQLNAIARQFTDQFGRAVEVVEVAAQTRTTGIVTVRMERAVGQLSLSIEGSGEHRINGLRLLEFSPTNDTVEAVKADLLALDGKVAAYFGPLDGSSATLTINSEAQMPLGSAMKLYALGALGEEVALGKRGWDDVITLDTKSFPSGQMQNWPQGSPVTLHTLASLMISISDNTATDQLIAALGRDVVERYMRKTGHSAPELNTPWINTRELFLIKGGASQTLDAYSAGSPTDRAAILQTLEDDPATLEQINAKLAAGPVAIDTVEWFANTQDLARLFQTMRVTSDPAVFEIMAINPALPQSVTANWKYVGFKGGSETGVLNMTWLLQDTQGQEQMLTLSWSNSAKAVETQTLLLIAQRILSMTQ